MQNTSKLSDYERRKTECNCEPSRPAPVIMARRMENVNGGRRGFGPLKCKTKVWRIAKSNLKTTEWKRSQLPAPRSHLKAPRTQEWQKLALPWQLWSCKRLQRFERMSGDATTQSCSSRIHSGIVIFQIKL